MRPIRIEIEGFTAFRELTVIDFEDLDLFVLFGPTGSGKSSILDAMTWSLYGEIARMGTTHLGEFITSGKTACTVAFTFKIRSETFRVVRKMHRTSTASSASVHLIDGENEIGRADGIRETNEFIEQKVGIDYDAFSRAVFLPQGKFAEFLQLGGRDRRDLISDLFQLNYLEDMRKRASGRARDLGSDSKDLRKRLEDDYSDVSAESVEATRVALQAAEENGEKAAEEATAAAEAHREYSEAFARVKEVTEARKALAEQKERTEAVENKGKELERARAAERVLPALDRHEELTKEHSKTEEALSAAEEALSSAISKLESAKERLESASREGEQVDAWRDKISVLEKQHKVLEKLEAGREKSKELAERVGETEQKIEENETKRAEAEVQGDEAAAEIATKKESLEELGFDEDRRELYEEKRDALKDYIRLSAEIDARRVELEAKTDEVSTARTEVDQTRKALEQEERKAAEAKERVELARREIQRLERSNQAQAIRLHLHEGDNCPVCEQSVSRVPEVESGVESLLENARNHLKDAEQKRQESDEALAAKRRSHDQAKSKAEHVSEERSALESSVADKVRDVESLEESIGSILDLHDRAEAALAECDRLRAAAKRAQDLKSEIQKAETRAEAAKINLQNSKERAEDLVEQKSMQEADRTAQRQRVKDLEAELGDDVPAEPEAKIKSLNERIDEVIDKIESCEKKVAEAGQLKAAARATIDERRATVNAVKEKLESASAAMREALAREGFEDAKAARDAVRETRVREELQNEIEMWTDEVRSLEDLVERLAGEVGDEELSAERLEDLEKQSAAKRTARDEAQQKLGELSNTIKSLEAKLEKKADYETRLAELSKEYDLYNRLATLLRTDRFQAFVIEEYLDQIVRGASSQLMKLSGRYTLRYDDESFVVVDHDNAQEERDAKTLSGGETFLASLSLALQLSEEIQKSAGNLQLDSLFIDEGFGTLDAETLDTVAEAIESLQQSGRLVGVITHIEEMMARLPQKIEVIKEVGGSRVEVGTAV